MNEGGGKRTRKSRNEVAFEYRLKEFFDLPVLVM